MNRNQALYAAPSSVYKGQAQALLKQTFKRLSVKAVDTLFYHNEYHFTRTYTILKSINIDASRVEIVRALGALSKTEQIVLKGARKNMLLVITDVDLLRELADIEEFSNVYNRKLAPVGRVAHLTGNRKLAPPAKQPVDLPDNRKIPPGKQDVDLIDDRKLPPAGQVVLDLTEEEEDKENVPITPKNVAGVASMLSPSKSEDFECGCCFGDFPLKDMVLCEHNGHMFCRGCLERHVQEQMFTEEIPCMSVEDCDSHFSDAQVDTVLNTPARKKRHENIWKAAVQRANIPDLVSCPRCPQEYEIEAGMIFICCPVCKHKFCRKCKEEPHKGQTCEKAKEKRDRLKGIHSAADKMTAAVMRKCPKCALQFFKEEGCNKMKCPRCKTASCYLCSKIIKDYTHFCQTPHCSHLNCGKCVLFTNTVEDDKRARREAGEQAGADQLGILSPVKSKRKQAHPAKARPRQEDGQLAVLQDNIAGAAPPAAVAPVDAAPAAHGRRDEEPPPALAPPIDEEPAPRVGLGRMCVIS